MTHDTRHTTHGNGASIRVLLKNDSMLESKERTKTKILHARLPWLPPAGCKESRDNDARHGSRGSGNSQLHIAPSHFPTKTTITPRLLPPPPTPVPLPSTPLFLPLQHTTAAGRLSPLCVLPCLHSPLRQGTLCERSSSGHTVSRSATALTVSPQSRRALTPVTP